MNRQGKGVSRIVGQKESLSTIGERTKIKSPIENGQQTPLKGNRKFNNTPTRNKQDRSEFPSSIISDPVDVSASVLQQRRMRFAKSQNERAKQRTAPYDPTKPIVGTSRNIEKAYFRLTTQPIPEDIRPQPILEMALTRLKKMMKENANYEYILDQLKAIRQDLVVQHIENEFTVKVYEYNAKLAIRASNLNELNQCQTMLSNLYLTIPSKKQLRFLSYHILYDILMNNAIDMHRHVYQAHFHLNDSNVQFALLVLEAVQTNNFPYFMKLYEAAPKLTKELMSLIVPKMRNRMIKITLSSILPSIPISVLSVYKFISLLYIGISSYGKN